MKYVVKFGEYYYISDYSYSRGKKLELTRAIQKAMWLSTKGQAEYIAKKYGGQVLALDNVLQKV